MAPTGTTTSRPLVAGYGLWAAFGVALAIVPGAYVALASSNPGAALLVASLAGFASAVLGTLIAWPAERKITWQRQAEVLGYRLGVALGVYVGLGVLLLFLANTFTPQEVPLSWPGQFLRRVPFWPFYSLVILGCRTFLPAPPDACLG